MNPRYLFLIGLAFIALGFTAEDTAIVTTFSALIMQLYWSFYGRRHTSV